VGLPFLATFAPGAACSRRRPAEAKTTRSARVAGIAEVITDAHVPEAHRGLHSSLYGDSAESAEAAHASSESSEAESLQLPGRLDGSELLDLCSWLREVKSRFDGQALLSHAIGLYAVYDSQDSKAVPWRVSYSRRVHFDLARINNPKALYARVLLLDTTSEHKMWTRARLEEARAEWLQELGVSSEDSAASSSSREISEANVLGQAEKDAFEERKWKLQLAMGQRIQEEDEESDDSSLRRERLRNALEGDDWSAVVSKQTAATEQSVPSDARDTVASPFSSGTVQQGDAGYDTSSISRELTIESVNEVLEAVRPILIADGGDVEVLGVDSRAGTVTIAMLGACTSCPAAPSTIASGIERCLVEHFGADVMREVIRVDSGAEAISEAGMRAAVQGHLGDLQDAMAAEGATAKLHEGASGELQVHVDGSEMLFQLVKSSLTYRFPEFAGRFVVLHGEVPQKA